MKYKTNVDDLTKEEEYYCLAGFNTGVIVILIIVFILGYPSLMIIDLTNGLLTPILLLLQLPFLWVVQKKLWSKVFPVVTKMGFERAKECFIKEEVNEK